MACQARTVAGMMCVARAKMFDGQKDFCGKHHKVKLRDDPEYAGRIEVFKTDPARLAAQAALNMAEVERNRLGADQPPAARRRATTAVTAGRAALLAAENAVRERQHPGVVAAELAARARVRAARQALLVAQPHLREREQARRAVQAARAALLAPVGIAGEDVLAARLQAFNMAAARFALVNFPGHINAQGLHVFERDPDGGINLRAMAADTQSVHRSSVVSSVEAAIHRLLARPLAADQRTLDEALAVLPTPDLRDELQRDYNLAHGFGLPYAKVLDHVWGTLRAHEHKADITQRFVQELTDGRGMCHTGKLTRLVNVLAGFDDAVGDLMPPAELFQSRFARLADRPLAEREVSARDLFREFAIPEAEQAAWLEPLLEA